MTRIAPYALSLIPIQGMRLRALKKACHPHQPRLTPCVGISHLRRLNEQAPKEIPTTERVGSFILATALQSDHGGRKALPENRGARRSLLRVPCSGQRQAHYNLIRVERRNGAGASPPLVSGKCRRSTATSDHRCVQRSAHEKDLTRQAYLHKSGKPRTRKGYPDNGQSGCEVGGQVNRIGGLQMGNDTMARLKVLGRTALNRSYGSVADSPGDLPRRLIND